MGIFNLLFGKGNKSKMTIEDEYMDLVAKYTFEETDKSIKNGQQINTEVITENVVNRVSIELMKKYSLTETEMIQIIKHAHGNYF